MLIVSSSFAAVEIFHIIIDQLHENRKAHPDHLRNVRLACREVESETRIRFGQGFFHTIVLDLLCIPDDFVRATNVLQDDWFRKCIQQIELRVGNPTMSFYDGQERVSILDRGLERHFTHQFANVLTQTMNVKRLHFVGSAVLPEATMEVRKKVLNACHNVAIHALHVLSAHDPVQIEELTLGRDHFLSPSITAAMLQHVPSDSTAFSELASLSVFTVTGAEHVGAPLPMNCPRAAELLANFLGLTPKLQTLHLTGGNSVYTVCQNHFTTNLLPPLSKQPPALQRLQLTDITLTQDQLAGGLLALGATLEELVLDNVQVMLGTWQAVLRAMGQLRKLAFVRLDDLNQDAYWIIFESVTRQRPFMMDEICTRAERDQAQYIQAILSESAALAHDSAPYRAKDEEIREAVADGWVWVFHDSTNGYRIALDAREGDDMNMWLTMVEQQHTLL